MRRIQKRLLTPTLSRAELNAMSSTRRRQAPRRDRAAKAPTSRFITLHRRQDHPSFSAVPHAHASTQAQCIAVSTLIGIDRSHTAELRPPTLSRPYRMPMRPRGPDIKLGEAWLDLLQALSAQTRN